MAKTAVKKSVCGSCGIAVRKGALFCFSCGEPVSKKPAVEINDTVQYNGRVVEDADPTVPLPAEPIQIEKTAEPEPDVVDSTNLRSAASIRRGAKAFNRKPVEVVWVERERSPTVFIIVSIVLVVFTAVLLALAIYLK